ncbi:hypothetical protein ANN_14470 [Periplaneta americana]|uniref:Uncharacterized protein n=1 Tax=Periplaneta americana TaxID=6978 RepID=A0ABQ8SYJ3_PERAM|nr:hypothetical protein ANN_14470 [Periplaneta americana]
MVGRQLVRHGPPALTLDALWTRIQTAWREIPQEHIQTLFDAWPARSSDMSPIEYVWNMVGRQLVRHGPPALTLDALWTRIQTEWREIPQEHIQTLFDPWPARSPDMSPIEHVWNMVGRQLVRHGHPAPTLEALWTHIQTAWREIPQEHIQTLFDSMPRCLKALIAVHGGVTPYGHRSVCASLLYSNGRQHPLKWVKGKRSRPVCPVVQQEEVESMPASSYDCTIVQCVLRGLLSKNLKVRIYKTVILPVVTYGCETWTLTLREEHRLRVFESKVLRKIFGAKRDEVTGEWRKLHNTELHAFYSSDDIMRNIKSRRLRWAGHVGRMGESRNAYRVLVGRPEGKRLLGRHRRRWEDNIKMDLREVGYDDREWINLAQDRDLRRAYVRAAMNLRVP